MSYLKKSLQGISWAAALRVGVRAFTILRTIILARILTPGQFGAFGIAAMALGLMEIFTETGINVFLLQEKNNYLDYINSAWVVSILRGSLITIAIILTAPFVANYFSSPEALNLLYLVSVVPLIRGLINPACVKLVKDLRFDQEFVYRTVILFSEMLVSIGAAFITHSASSFAWGMIVSAVVEVIMSFVFIKVRPKLKYELQKIKHVLNQGKWVTGFGLFDYVFTQGDNISVGRLLGEAPLGIYKTAYSLSTLPVTEISETYYKVMFPVFTEMKDDTKRLKKASLKSAILVAMLMTLAGLAVFVFADPVVKLLLGAKWLPAIPVIKILAFAGLFRGLSYLFNPLFVALGKQKYVTVIIFVSMLGLLITIIPLIIKFGILGAGYSAVLASIITLPATIYFAIRTLRRL